MPENSVLILGAGAAGLTAADELSQAGFSVTILEARDRAGGRIHTLRFSGLDVPVELGAEFVHGAKNDTWPLLRAAHFKTDELPDRHWQSVDGSLVENPKFWDHLSAVFERIDLRTPDQDFFSFLNRNTDLSEQDKWLATEYVEGFHAAPASRVSAHSLLKAEAAAEREKGMRQFRLRQGYTALVDWLTNRLQLRGVPLLCQHIVKTVCWEPHGVEVEAATPTGPTYFRARAAVIALPLGVLREDGPSSILFEPPLSDKQPALQGLEPAAVVKVIFRFRCGFWPVESFGFLHTDDPNFPTWWMDERGPLLTGWAGGPRAERLSRESRASILGEAVDSLVRIFKIERSRIVDLQIDSWTHDWMNDAFARGAYSYTPVGMGRMPAQLGEPMHDTLFFAGEATAPAGDQGTVHGAVATGKRAADEIKRAVLKRTTGRQTLYSAARDS